MSRLLLPLAGVAVLVVVAVVAVGSLAAPAPTDDAARARALAAELRCPDCQALSVAESRTAAAAAIRAEIEAQVAAGRSDAEIRAHFVDRYGSWILLVPADPLIWILPVAALLAGAAGLVIWLHRGRSSEPVAAAATGPVDGERRRIRDELEALDG